MSDKNTKKKSKKSSKSLESEFPLGMKIKDINDLKLELIQEQKARDTIEWSNAELERSVMAMERNVYQLESGNIALDDSEDRQKYENQKQLNIQLQEQKRWLEHELEQIKLKIQNDKTHPLPDSFSLDWDTLSETELKRLVSQLEKTKNDLVSDLREMEWKMDKEGRDFHHYDDFVQSYFAEIKNLNRTIDALIQRGLLPADYYFKSGSTITTILGEQATNAKAPGTRKVSSNALSPPIARRKISSEIASKTKITDLNSSNPNSARSSSRSSSTRTLDPKFGTARKTAGIRNLPKLSNASSSGLPPNLEKELKEIPLPNVGSKQRTSELDTVKEALKEDEDNQ